MKPHKWAKEIHAWADGAEIEYRKKTGYGCIALDWVGIGQQESIDWLMEEFEFRIKPQPMESKYGEVITGRLISNTWLEEHEARIATLENQIKPQPKEPQYLYVYSQGFQYEFSKSKEKTMKFVCGDRMLDFNYIGKIKLEQDDGA